MLLGFVLCFGLDNFSPRLELLVSDAVKRQMTKDDEKHQKVQTFLKPNKI